MKDNRDKIIELLKTECGLKGQLLNLILEVPEMSRVLGENNIMPTLENCINEINKVHDEVVQLEILDDSHAELDKIKN